MGKSSEMFLQIREQEEMSKESMNNISSDIVRKAESGESSALPEYIKLDFVIKSLKMAQDKIRGQSIQESTLYPKEDSMMGVNFRRSDGSSQYDYSSNQEWVRLKDEIKEIEKDMKAAANSKHEIYDKSNGDIIMKAKVSFKKPSITITYNK